MTELLSAADVRQRLAKQFTASASRKKRRALLGNAVIAGLATPVLVGVHLQKVRLLSPSGAVAAAVAFAALVALTMAYRWHALRPRSEEAISDGEVESALRWARPCRRCARPVLLSEPACPSCGSRSHQWVARPEFLLIPLVLLLWAVGTLLATM